MRTDRARPCALLMLGFAVLAGCTHLLATADVPSLQTGSPLRGVVPKTFAVREFKDIRGGESGTVVRKSGAYTFATEEPVTALVARSICRELVRNGHVCIDKPAATKADFFLEGEVYRFTFRAEGLLFVGNAAVKLTISRVSPAADVLVKSYQSVSERKPTNNLWKPAMIDTMIALMKEISNDPELIAFIDK